MKLKLLALVLSLQVVWIIGTVATQETSLSTAPTVLLETQPVDPRDMLRGDYVILNYKISRLEFSQFKPPLTNQPAAGTPVFVVLEKRGAFHEAAYASLAFPAAQPGQTVIRGDTEYAWQANSVRVHYGLERYYVAEGTGNPTGKLTVEAAVPKSGKAVIKQVFVDGKPYREVMDK